MKAHPYSEIFPAMEGADFAALVDDIRAHGLLQPLVMYEGRILDGRNRWRACEKLGIKPKTTEYQGKDPLGFVLSLNLARRHLDESQRAVVAAKLATLKHGGDRKSPDQDANLRLEKPQAVAAKALNVSERSVTSARKVLDKGTPELKKAVEKGEMPVSVAAKLAEAPAKTQKAAVEGGKAVAREIAAKVVEAKKEEPSKPLIRTLGLNVPAEILARAAKEQELVDKIGRLLADAKRTYTELEKIRGVEQFGKGQHISSSFRTAINELNRLQGTRPACVCPHCKLLPELKPTCACCRSAGFIGEHTLDQIEKILLAEGDDSGVWVKGKWRTYASMTGDDF